MFDLLSDILSVLSKHKLRTFLTGFSMAWGIFMLVVLLGCGNGLMNAMMLNFSNKSTNITHLWGGRTTMAHGGFQAGRKIILDDDLLQALKKQIPQIGRIAPTLMVWSVLETYNGEYTSGGGLYGITPEYCELSDFKLIKGRAINKLDHELKRKVVIMNDANVKVLFKDEDPIGKYIVVNHVPYQVIGIYSSTNMEQNQPDVIPLTTMKNVYSTMRGYGSVMLEINGITNKESSDKFDEQLYEAMASMLQFNKDDKSAVWMWNEASSYLETMNIFHGINFFLWLITIGTMIAGIVGISNIMLITVKDRTKEFGIRKSLGARPASVMKLILTESLLITLGFGYIGLVAGVGLLELLCKVFPRPETLSMENMTTFVEPGIDISIAIIAMAILTMAGLAAAYIPAKKAVQVKPVEAMHYE